MTICDWMLIILGAIIVLPILAFLCVKLGTFGFYKGKEAYKRKIDVTTISDKKSKYEKL